MLPVRKKFNHAFVIVLVIVNTHLNMELSGQSYHSLFQQDGYMLNQCNPSFIIRSYPMNSITF